ncbi:MAG: formate--phosphoribosylaminoimidazolecarboxamide ligase [Candidatus Nitrosocaldus sp.]|nr:formate--phosphoribosylaminoimidazolecarboxamide ligase [Candidatus Nitrosocaldus sp.]MDW7999687.1 formate--phosphoribosylaminoimidazolecarboxamide ligase [Candidatus Nitrosocaldus sp.]
MNAIGTLGSHCALQVLKGAKDEGFKTILVCEGRREGLYRRFRFIDRLIPVEDYRFEHAFSESIQNELHDNNCILVPHGTYISSMKIEEIESIRVPFFGNRWILRWEADRVMKERLMLEARLNVPRSVSIDELGNSSSSSSSGSSSKDAGRLVIAKLHGAAGGKGYFLAWDRESFMAQYNKLLSKGMVKSLNDLYIQEYVLGVPVYLQYFYSPLSREVELLGIDRRYESNVDAIGRVPALQQEHSGIHEVSYNVVGNSPLVLRESLLDEVYRMGERFVAAAERLVKPGMIGPFCIEGVYDQDGRFISFEFSARIVAGTNLYVNGSPYSYLLYDEPMSMGRRIAREVRTAIESRELDKVVT